MARNSQVNPTPISHFTGPLPTTPSPSWSFGQRVGVAATKIVGPSAGVTGVGLLADLAGLNPVGGIVMLAGFGVTTASVITWTMLGAMGVKNPLVHGGARSSHQELGDS